jgi:hypothetical protein
LVVLSIKEKLMTTNKKKSDLKTFCVHTRLNKEEYEYLSVQAASERRTLAGYLRGLLLNEKEGCSDKSR